MREGKKGPRGDESLFALFYLNKETASGLQRESSIFPPAGSSHHRRGFVCMPSISPPSPEAIHSYYKVWIYLSRKIETNKSNILFDNFRLAMPQYSLTLTLSRWEREFR